jgi:Mrp family chromosome partitioning ATPase
MRTFVADMLKSYQFIILDAPPVMGLADARVLAPIADGVVLVVRAGTAQKPSIRRACWHLESVGATVLGTVLNDAAPDEDGYHYYGEYASQDAH